MLTIKIIPPSAILINPGALIFSIPVKHTPIAIKKMPTRNNALLFVVALFVFIILVLKVRRLK